MAESTGVTRSQGAAVAALFAAVSLGLFVLGAAAVVDATWVWIASLITGLLAAWMGFQARRGAGGSALGTLAMAIGGILVLVQVGWLVLSALGVIDDTT